MSAPTEADPYILVSSGAKFYFHRPEDFKYDIRQIAKSLSHLCRFTGNTSEFYSVAQHSVFCSTIVDSQFALEALLHDASEAFLSDLSTPLKELLPQYRALETPTQQAINSYFGVHPVGWAAMSPAVLRADLMALATEKRDLMPFDDTPWTILEGVKPHPFKLNPESPSTACLNFLERFATLTER